MRRQLSRSELAREGLESGMLIQDECVIVHVHREQARAYRAQRSLGPRLVSFTFGVAISDGAHRPCRQTPNRSFGHFDALLCFSSTGYSPDVADHSAIGCGNPAKPAQQRLHLEHRHFYVCDLELWRLCVGRPRACRFPWFPVYHPAYSCLPFVW
jgi:hypothetical protein